MNKREKEQFRLDTRVEQFRLDTRAQALRDAAEIARTGQDPIEELQRAARVCSRTAAEWSEETDRRALAR